MIVYFSLALILLSGPLQQLVQAFTFTPQILPIIRQHVPSTPLIPHQSTSKKIIDAEFTHSSSSSNDGNSSIANNQMTLIEYSQNQDPDWKSMPVAFCDLQSNTYIDCTLAFYVKSPDDGQEYCLGVPCEDPIVVAIEMDMDGVQNDKVAVTHLARVLPINPDESENGYDAQIGCYAINEEQKKEVFELAARALSDAFGKGIRLKKTPRVLTIQGDLDAVIGDWKEVLLKASSNKDDKNKMKRPDIDEALIILDEDEEEGEKYFDMIMRRDLGDDYEKLIEGDDTDVDEDILKLFDVNAEDLEDGDMEEFLKFMNDSLGEVSIDASATYDALLQELKPSAALKLLSFAGPDEKEFAILRPLRPLLLVAKEDPDDYTRRILLSEKEKRAILPDLERVCKDQLEQAGFFLSSSNE